MKYKLVRHRKWLIDKVEADHSGSIGPNQQYDIPQFARDDTSRFLALVEHLNPRDREMLILYALLAKRPTDLSILFGKAGHRAEENLHKAILKLAGLAEFGVLPPLEQIRAILGSDCKFGRNDLGASIWEYARCRDFGKMARLLGHPGLRAEMFRSFKKLHASPGRDSGLLAGWILWLVDGANPRGKGWAKNKTSGRYKLGPRVFRTFEPDLGRVRTDGHAINPRLRAVGGRREKTAQLKVKRHYKFLLRGMDE